MKKRKEAFTLLEIMVTVVIVAVLAAIAVPQMSIMVEKFRAEEGVHIIRDGAGAEERYYIENGTYTSNASELMDAPALQYFDLPQFTGNATNWRVEVNRSNQRYQLFTTKAFGPQEIHCREVSGGPDPTVQAICLALGFIYGPTRN